MYIANYIINFGTCRTRGMSAPAGFFLTTRAYETKSCSRTAACRSCLIYICICMYIYVYMYIINYIINFGTCRTRGMSAPARLF